MRQFTAPMGAACLLLVLTSATESQAVAIAVSTASSETTLLSSGGMTVSISPGGEDATKPLFSEVGAGVVTVHEAMNEVGIGSLFADVSVSAGAPPVSSALATSLTGDRIRLDNSAGAASATAEFTFFYHGAAVVSTTEPFESAVAKPFFHITGIEAGGGEILEVDEGAGFVIVPEFLVDLFQDTTLGDTGKSATDTIGFKITIPEFSIHEFSVITDSHGAVHADVPEPHSLVALTSLGLVGGDVFRYRGR